MSFRALLIFGLFASLLGCSVRDANPVVHKAPIETEPPAPLSSGDNSPVDANTVAVLGNKRFGEILASANDAEQIYSQVIAPMAGVLLKPAVYQSRKTVSSPEFLLALTDFNKAILKLAKLDAKRLNSSGILKQYKEAIYVDCRIDLQGTCPNLNIYARENHFPNILVLMAKAETDVLEYYRHLYAALERSRPEMDQELNRLYLDRHQELARLYLNVSEGETKSNKDMEVLRMHARVLQNVLQDFDPNQISRAQMDRLMEHFNPWDVSRRTGGKDGMPAVGVDKILGWAASGYMYTDSTRTKLDPSFQKRVIDILNSKDEIYGLGLREIFNRIQASNSKGILRNFDLSPDFEPNEYVYLLDRIFYNHFTIDDATLVWNHTNKDKAKLFKALNLFVRLQIANMIFWTNSEMNRFFKEKGDVYKDFIALLRGAVNNSMDMHVAWNRTLNRVDGLIQFADREYGKVDPFYLPDSDEYKQFNTSVSGLRHNIKMLSVYPNMMMIVYLMAKKNFSATINTWFGPITITPYQVIKWFFIEVMSPWFNFGTDGSKLSQVELLYAIHFSMVTETFSSFRDNPVIPVSEAEFFATVTEKLINDETQTMINSVQKMNQHALSNAKNIREALTACTEERQLQKIERPGEILPRRYARVFSYENLRDRYANGNTRASETQLGALIRFYESSMSLDSTITTLMTTSESRLLFVRNMYGIMRDYLLETGGAVAPLDEAYNNEVAKFIEVRNEYFKGVYEQLEQYSDCDKVLFKHEKDLRDQTLAMEENYLATVYDRLIELNADFKAGRLEAARANAVKFNAAIAPKDVGLPQTYLDRGGYDRFTENAEGFYFNYHKLDALIRLRRNIVALSPNTEITLPNFDKLTEYQAPTPIGLLATEGQRQTFIDDGMRKYVDFASLAGAYVPTHMLDKLDLLARLYRVGPVGKDGALNCTGKECFEVTAEKLIRETIDVVKISNIGEYDLKLMNWLGKDELYDDTYWARVAIESGNRRHLGLLDLTFQRVASDDSADLHAGLSTYFLTMTKKYFDTEMSVGNFFFAPRPSVKEMIKKNYATYVADYEAKVEAFLAKYEELRGEPDLQVTEVRRTRRDNISVPTAKNKEGNELPVYITTERKNRYYGVINTFHEATSGEFKTRKP